MSDVVAGVAWAADSAAEQAALKAQGKNSKHKGSVANMSLGGGKSQALDDAVDAAVEDGLHFAVAVSQSHCSCRKRIELRRGKTKRREHSFFRFFASPSLFGHIIL